LKKLASEKLTSLLSDFDFQLDLGLVYDLRSLLVSVAADAICSKAGDFS